uniref:Uncharacterized protein n=1 Tax=Ursus americanus TaxID=9643 RepID=A0A452R6D1_URSAM
MNSPAATPFRWKKCRLDLPGRGAHQACKHLPDEHNDVQKKTFTKWINARFSKVTETFKHFMVIQMPLSD